MLQCCLKMLQKNAVAIKMPKNVEKELETFQNVNFLMIFQNF